MRKGLGKSVPLLVLSKARGAVVEPASVKFDGVASLSCGLLVNFSVARVGGVAPDSDEGGAEEAVACSSMDPPAPVFALGCSSTPGSASSSPLSMGICARSPRQTWAKTLFAKEAVKGSRRA